MGKIELVTAVLIIIAPPALLLTDRRHDLAPTCPNSPVARTGPSGNSSNFSYVNFMQNFPASVAVYVDFSRPRSFSFLRSQRGAKWIPSVRASWIGPGILEILAGYFSLKSPLPRRLRRGDLRIYIIRGTLSGSQPWLWSAFKNNEDHFLCSVIFLLSDLLASSSFPLLPDLLLDVAPLIYFPWD